MFRILDKEIIKNKKFNISKIIYIIQVKSDKLVSIENIIFRIFQKDLKCLLNSKKSRIGFSINFFDFLKNDLHIGFSDLSNVENKIKTISNRLNNISQSNTFLNLNKIRFTATIISKK